VARPRRVSALLYAKFVQDGGSWKESLVEDSSLKDIIKLASTPKTGLLAGPGNRIQNAMITLSEAVLDEQYAYVFTFVSCASI
jgi:hypothetical protein